MIQPRHYDAGVHVCLVDDGAEDAKADFRPLAALDFFASMAGFQDPLWRAFARLFFLLSFLVSRLMLTTAQPATLQFSDCFSSSNTSQKLDVSTVYAQFFPQSTKGAYINFTVIGTSPQEIIAASNGTNPVASTSQSSALRES